MIGWAAYFQVTGDSLASQLSRLRLYRLRLQGPGIRLPIPYPFSPPFSPPPFPSAIR